MQALKKNITTIKFKENPIQLWVPDQPQMQKNYQQQGQKSVFPYWAKIWPSSIAISNFILEHPELIKNKTVLELAAGLGLPSLVASQFASSIICSDYDACAVAFIQDNIALNGVQNVRAVQIDWTHLPTNLSFDLLLLSDINYDPKQFEILLTLMKTFLEKGGTILLSTPQRLAGRAFIEQLIPYAILNEEILVEQVAINVLVLKN